MKSQGAFAKYILDRHTPIPLLAGAAIANRSDMNVLYA